MSYRIYNGTQLLGDVNNKSTGINGLLPATSYQFGVSNHDGNRESQKATINVKTRGIRLIIPTSLTVNSTITLNYQEYSLGLVPIGTEPAGMFGGGNKRDIQAKVISVDNGKSTVELLEPLESSSTVSIGGINLVRNSAHDPSSLDHWTTNNVGKVLYVTHSFFRNGTTKMFFLNNTNTDQEMLIQTEYMDIEPDTDYTLSMVVFGASGVSSGDVYYNIKYADGSNTYFNVDGRFKYNPYRAERKVYKFHTSPNSSGSKATQVFIRVDNNGLIPGYSDGTSMLGDVKLEKGNVATDWSPAPEDTQYIVDNTQMNRLQDGSFATFNGYRAIYFRQ